MKEIGINSGIIMTEPISKGAAIREAGFSPESLAQTLDWLNEGVLIINTKGSPYDAKIIYVNPRFCEMVQVEECDLVGKSPVDFFDPKDMEYLAKKTNQMDESGRVRYEFVLPKKDGTKIPVIQSSQMIPCDSCECGNQLLLITATDITEQKRVQAKLEEANRRLLQYQTQMAQDLQLAEQVQRALIPTKHRMGRLQIASRYVPMIGIGGDYVYVRKGHNGRIYLTVCDVVGHGVAASLIANYIISRVSRLIERGVEGPDALLYELNDITSQILKPKMLFFTYAVVEVNLEEERCIIACAGHPPVYHVTAEGVVTSVHGPFSIMGIFQPLQKYGEITELPLRAGDRLVLYTDGIPEARNRDNDEFFGQERMERILSEHSRTDGEEVCDLILDSITQYTNNRVRDDITLMIATMDELNEGAP